jgi:DNA-binding transcriptional MerR regulator
VIEAGDSEAAVVRKPVKSEAAFRTISEVSEDLDVPQHVLRFWESKFPQIKPLKRGGGRRYYRPEDLQLLKRIRDLLYKDGYTIKGVQKLLKEETPAPSLIAAETVRSAASVVQPELRLEPAVKHPWSGEARSELERLLSELQDLRALLGNARHSK